MNRLVLATIAGTLAVTGTLGKSAHAADVAVSVRIGEPGFYGRIDIVGYPQPQLIYAQPVVITQAPPGRPPVYLRVPPGHAKHWSKHCNEYKACGEHVYFVKDDWYAREYAPRYRKTYVDDHRPPPAPHRKPAPHGQGQGHGKNPDRAPGN